MQPRKLRLAALGAVCAATAGCATPPPPANVPDSATLMIADAAQNATAALRRLSEVEGRTRVVKAVPTDQAPAESEGEKAGNASAAISVDVPPGLEQTLTVKWNGDLEELMARIAHLTGWTFSGTEGRRAAPVLISLYAKNKSAFSILQDIGAIAGHAADVVVQPDARTLSLKYPVR